MAALPPRKPAPSPEPAITVISQSDVTYEESELVTKDRQDKLVEKFKEKLSEEIDKYESKQLVILDGMSYQLDGSTIKHDLLHYLEKAKALHASFDIEPEDDEEISFRNSQVWKIKEARAKLKTMCSEVTAQYVSLDEFNRIAKELDGVLQKTQSLGEDQVKNSKARKIADIKARYQQVWNDEFVRLSKMVAPLFLPVAKPDFETAMKNKKTYASLEESAKNQVAFCVQLAERVAINYAEKLKIIRAHAGLQFLFADLEELVDKEMVDLKIVITDRIAAHNEAEAKKAEALRIKIAAEEKAKAEKLKLDELQKIEDARLAEQNRLEREARAKQVADDLAKSEALKTAAARTNESALRAETGAEMRKEQARAAEMIETAKKLEAEAPKKLNPEMPSLQRVLSALQKAFFLTMPESEQLLSDSADELEKRRYQHMRNEKTPGVTAAGHAE